MKINRNFRTRKWDSAKASVSELRGFAARDESETKLRATEEEHTTLAEFKTGEGLKQPLQRVTAAMNSVQAVIKLRENQKELRFTNGLCEGSRV